LQSIQAWYASISKDFYQNLIYADRYKFLLNGLRETLTITLFAAIFGAVLGCVIALMRLSETKIGKWHFLNTFASAYVDVIRGTPAVVQLMILYFIILTYVREKTMLAIIAFSLNSAAYVSEMVRGGILAVDAGQTEAGRSLGLSKAATMWLIIMPQAFKIVLPSLFNELIMLLKETAIVGIIGHMDLAKSADYIRSLTFSPFFPLISMALVYYLIVSILTRVFARLERRLRQGDQH
jgi:His/Glu/Gln/Arg/opine family amino acid ABC transporter permease subunit